MTQVAKRRSVGRCRVFLRHPYGHLLMTRPLGPVEALAVARSMQCFQAAIVTDRRALQIDSGDPVGHTLALPGLQAVPVYLAPGDCPQPPGEPIRRIVVCITEAR